MEPATMIALAVKGISFAVSSIEKANQGDMTGAKADLDAARQHFDQSVADWDAAGESE